VDRLPESVDRDILEGRRLPALSAIRASRGCSLREAIDLYEQRYCELHPEPPPPPEQPPTPRVLRFTPDGTLIVFEPLEDNHPPPQ
jgi:hypothetical protein